MTTTATKEKRVLLVRPRGFCAGVERAIEIVDICLSRFPSPVYVRKEIVHNKAVVESFKARGVIFVNALSEVPEGSLVVFSAHGVSPAVWERARERGLRVLDASCPLVTKVHREVHRFVNQGKTIILIGHEGHDEVLGTMGQAPGRILLVGSVEEAEKIEVEDPEQLVYLTQTTLSVDETKETIDVLKRRFPGIIPPPGDDICYATQNRQDAVKKMVSEGVEAVLVVGSKNSSNSLRLCEVARRLGTEAFLIDEADDIDTGAVDEFTTLGVTAGASAPEHLVQGVITCLQRLGFKPEEKVIIEESVRFSLPEEIRDEGSAS